MIKKNLSFLPQIFHPAEVIIIPKLLRWIRYNLRYLGSPPWDSGKSPPELVAWIKKTTPGQALDLGAGTGTNMVTLAQAGWGVEGIEYAIIAVMAARKKLKKLGFPSKIYWRDVTNLRRLIGPYDLVLDIGCFHGLSVRQKHKYLDNLRDWLADGGTFLIYAFYARSEGEAGISEEEIVNLSRYYRLVNRQEGMDGERQPSLWLEFKREKGESL